LASRRASRLPPLERHHGAEVVEQRLVDRRLIGRRLGRVAARLLQRRQIRGDVGHLRIGEAQIGHERVGVVVLRIAYPVEDPFVGGLVADVLERLAEGALRPGLGAGLFVDDVTPLAADRLDDLFAALGIAARRVRGFRPELHVVGEEIRDGRVDLDFVPDRVLG
jgi:hypothetical protein